MHIPFKLLVEIRTPFHMRFPVTLDALLVEALSNQTGQARETLLDRVPLAREGDLFRASSLRLERRPTSAGVGRIQALRGTFDLSTKAFSPNRWGKDYSKVDQQRGPYKSNLDSYDAISCPLVSWCAVGDPDAVVDLLTNHLIGIGKRASGGAGEIGAIEVVALDQDRSWMREDGRPARPLPLARWHALGGQDSPVAEMTVCWPYFNGPRVQAVFPTLR